MVTYPNITWPLFAAYNDDARKSFEDMCRRLFTRVKTQSLQGFPALESAADNKLTTNPHRNPKRFEAEMDCRGI